MKDKIGKKEDTTSKSYVIALAITIVVFLALYFSVATKHALNADEGLYATGALRFADGDLLLQKVDTDKPPLVYQLEGLAALLFGPTDFAVKIPNAISIALLFVVLFRLGRKLFNELTGIIAVLFIATSPYLGKVAIGAMTDPPAVLFLTWSLLCMVSGKTAWAGFLFGMALLTRQMALLYFPLIFMASAKLWWKGDQPGKEIYKEAKLFFRGIIAPAAWLVIWSAFFERSPFQWLLQELFSGKVTLGAKRAGITERTSFWLKEMTTFYFSWVALVVVGCLGLFFLYKHYKRDLSKSQKEKVGEKFAVIILAAAIFYYPIIHTLMGAPLYRRMMLPVLPLAGLLGAYLVAKIIRHLALEQKKRVKLFGLIIFCIILIVPSISNYALLARPHERDDNPMFIEKLIALSKHPSVIFSVGMNREMMFYLHKNKISRKQFKQDPTKFAELVKSYPGRKMFLALRQSEIHLLTLLKDSVKPRYRIEPLYETPRKFVTLFEVIPDADWIKCEESKCLSVYIDGEIRVMPISRETLEKALGVYVKKTLKCGKEPDVKIEFSDDENLLDGFLKSLEITASPSNLEGVEVDKVVLNYEDVRIDLVQLFAANHLVVIKSQKATGVIEATDQAISKYLRRKNKNIKNLKMEVDDSKVVISGSSYVMGMNFNFSIEGSLSVNEEGQVLIHPVAGKLNSWNIPAFILNIIGDNVNPTFYAGVLSLDLSAKELKLSKGRVTFFMK